MNWSKENIKKLNDLKDLGLTISEISDRMSVSYCSIETALRRYGIKSPESKLQTTDLKQFPPIEELINFVIKGQELVRGFDPRQREVFPEYKTKKWIGLIIHGDWHFEHYKTDFKELINDLKQIGQEQEVFYVFNGDAGDWADIRFKDLNMPSVLLPIELRYEILFHLISQIPNLLSVTAGCHDDWLKNRGWYDIIAAIRKKHNALGHRTYYLGYGGVINFKVGAVRYRIGVYHKYKGESALNDFMPCMKFLQCQDSSCDIVAIAHRHDKVGVAYQYYQHRPVIFVRSGSHQYITDYAWKEGFAGAIARAPMVLLNGAKKEMRACVNYKDGIKELRSLNAG